MSEAEESYEIIKVEAATELKKLRKTLQKADQMGNWY